MPKQYIITKLIISVFRFSLFAYFMLGGTVAFAKKSLSAPIEEKIIQKATIPSDKKNTDTWITVFVHGIKSVKPHISASNFIKFLRDDVQDTVYSKTVNLMRRDPYFYKNQVMQGLGLQKINPNDIRKGNAASAMAYLFEEMYKLIDAPKTNNYYYTFGWSGLLSPSMRFKDSTQFFIELEKEVKQYQILYNVTPKIRIIAYSHGGNVCLNLGAAHQEVFPKSQLVIDELILVGVPIQSETDYLVADSVFKRIYHFYSLADRIQKLDMFATDRIFSMSRRHFAPRSGFKPPKKLFQIQLKIMRNTHTSKKRKKRREKLVRDFSKPSIISGGSRLLRDISPGHTELWFFGWSPQHYRKHFPLHPLPNIAFAPIIIHEIKKVENKLPLPHPFIVDLRPQQETLLIKRKINKLVSKVNFISQKKLTELKKHTLLFKPDNFTLQLYNDHMYAAYEHALVLHTQKNKKKNPRAYTGAVKKQQEEQEKRLKRRKRHKTKQILVKTVTDTKEKHKKKRNRRGRKKGVITVSLHKEINCPFCYDPEVQRYLAV